MKDECVFCKIAKKEISAPIIYENDNFLSFPDANPKIKGHSLIIPKKHFNTILDIPNTLGVELMDCVKNTSLILMQKHSATGFNLLSNNFESAGQVVKHAHLHILPRQKSDGFNFF